MDVAALAKIEAPVLPEKTHRNSHQDNSLSLEDYKPAMEDNQKLVRSARRRIDFLVLPCLVLMFIFLQLDRTSLGNALTDNFAKDIKINQTQINIGQTLFTLGMVLFEIPANIAIKRLGAHLWLPSLMFAWGLVTICQMFVTSRSGFYATRFLLATCESGFIPGAAFYLGQFYTRNEMALRYALLWSANSFAGILSGIIALGLLSLRGSGGLKGWQWLWLIEGVLTCTIAVIALLHLPASPDSASRRLFVGNKFAILTPEQASALSQQVYAEDPSKLSQKSRKVALRDFDFFLDWKIYGHCATAFLTSVMFTPVNTYAPSIIKSLGFKGYTANGLNSVGSILALILSITLAWSSDRRRERGFHIIAGFLVSAVGLLWLALPPAGTAKGVLYAGVIVTVGGMGSVQGINAAWLSSKIQERQRPLALGSYVMSIQLASFVGSNLFRAQDAPRYKRPLLICAGCVLAGVVIAAVWKFLYYWTESKIAEESKRESSSVSKDEIEHVM